MEGVGSSPTFSAYLMPLVIQQESVMESKWKRGKVPSVIFPILMRRDMTNEVVLFSYVGCGVIVNKSVLRKDIGEGIGYYSRHWNMSEFTPLEGSVTLSND